MKGKKKNLTPDQIQNVITMNRNGMSNSKIADIFSVHRSTIGRVLRRITTGNDKENHKKRGRPRLTDERGDRKLFRIVKKNRRQTLDDITTQFNRTEPVNISKRTVRRRLAFEGYKKGKIPKTISISKVNRTRRVLWCRNKRFWTVSQWQKVIFSDETQVVIGQNNSVSVWRKSHEKWKHYCLNQRKTTAKFSCMFWGCITKDGVGTLVPIYGNLNSTKYIDLLDTNLWPVVAKVFGARPFIFQDDNAPPHVSQQTSAWKEENGINRMTWPAQSPDLNIIENVWRCLKIQLSRKVDEIDSRQDLIDTFTHLWTGLSRTYISSLFSSIPKRIRNVIIQKGFITKY